MPSVLRCAPATVKAHFLNQQHVIFLLQPMPPNEPVLLIIFSFVLFMLSFNTVMEAFTGDLSLL